MPRAARALASRPGTGPRSASEASWSSGPSVISSAPAARWRNAVARDAIAASSALLQMPARRRRPRSAALRRAPRRAPPSRAPALARLQRPEEPGVLRHARVRQQRHVHGRPAPQRPAAAGAWALVRARCGPRHRAPGSAIRTRRRTTSASSSPRSPTSTTGSAGARGPASLSAVAEPHVEGVHGGVDLDLVGGPDLELVAPRAVLEAFGQLDGGRVLALLDVDDLGRDDLLVELQAQGDEAGLGDVPADLDALALLGRA